MRDKAAEGVGYEARIKEYYPMIYRFVYMQVKNKADAQDITQEIFYKYLMHPIAFSDIEKEKAWLFTVASNQCKSYWRTGWYKRIFPMQDEIPELEHTPEREYENKERGFYVVACVAKLPQKYREIIHLFYYEDMSIEKISEITGKKKSTIQTQLDRGRKLLRKMMGED